MKATLTFLAYFVILMAEAQDASNEQAQAIVAEGRVLYKSEMASWYGTDIFLEKYTNRDNIGGYFSYLDGDVARCIFFSRSEQAVVIGSISFDSTYNVDAAKADLNERPFSAIESDLFMIRKLAIEQVRKDTLFKTYENTSLNLIPIVNKHEKKVYILTGPSQRGVVIFGNDYLIRFDDNNTITEKKALHKNIIPTYLDNENKDDTKLTIGAMHSHLPETGAFITATDICTLMLYQPYTNWVTYNVVSAQYLNKWDCITNSLTVIPLDAMKEPGKKNRKKNKNDN